MTPCQEINKKIFCLVITLVFTRQNILTEAKRKLDSRFYGGAAGAVGLGSLLGARVNAERARLARYHPPGGRISGKRGSTSAEMRLEYRSTQQASTAQQPSDLLLTQASPTGCSSSQA